MGRVKRREADLDRDLPTIAMQRGQLQLAPHRPNSRRLEEPRPVPLVALSQLRWNQHLDRLADELLATVAQQRLHLRVDPDDPSPLIDDHRRVGRGVD